MAATGGPHVVVVHVAAPIFWRRRWVPQGRLGRFGGLSGCIQIFRHHGSECQRTFGCSLANSIALCYGVGMISLFTWIWICCACRRATQARASQASCPVLQQTGRHVGLDSRLSWKMESKAFRMSSLAMKNSSPPSNWGVVLPLRVAQWRRLPRSEAMRTVYNMSLKSSSSRFPQTGWGSMALSTSCDILSGPRLAILPFLSDGMKVSKIKRLPGLKLAHVGKLL